MNNTAQDFYNSKAWRKCSKGYMQSVHYICERCGGLATICHHKTHITPQNKHDPKVTLNWDNLMALCIDCHNAIHYSKGGICADGLTFDENGNLKKI